MLKRHTWISALAALALQAGGHSASAHAAIAETARAQAETTGAARAQAASANLRAELSAAARRILGAGQSVYVEAADGTVLAAQAASRAVHPASVSKVATSLALLEKLGPNYRFTTRFAWRGAVVDGTLSGDITVSGDGDPALVDEDALLIAARLNALGIRRVAGVLHATSPLIFDWQPDPRALHLGRALSGHTPAAAWLAVRTVEAEHAADGDAPSRPALRFVGVPGSGAHIALAALTASPAAAVLLYRSEPLIAILKRLNDYSNNIFKSFAEAAGGAHAVQELARRHVPAAMRDEIILGDGAGTDPRNRLSPRAAVRLLRALEQELASSGHTLCDVLPVAGIDAGTLEARFDGPGETGRVVGKTGTYGSYGASALVGAFSTRERGTVYFAILDHGVPVPEARRRQDRFVRALLARFRTMPWPYHAGALSAAAQAQIEVVDR